MKKTRRMEALNCRQARKERVAAGGPRWVGPLRKQRPRTAKKYGQHTRGRSPAGNAWRGMPKPPVPRPESAEKDETPRLEVVRQLPKPFKLRQLLSVAGLVALTASALPRRTRGPAAS